MNVLILSAGTRCKLVEYMKDVAGDSLVITTDCSDLAPALYVADRYYVVPRVDAPGYMETILDICQREQVAVCFSLIDPELPLLAANQHRFEEIGTKVMISPPEAVARAFDKWQMHKFCVQHAIPTVRSWIDPEPVRAALASGDLSFPLYAKPRTGSASKDNFQIESLSELHNVAERYPGILIQEFQSGEPLDVDVYVDMVSGEVVSLFAKEKLRMREGTADKAISVLDKDLEQFVITFCEVAGFRGAIDIDLFRTERGFAVLEVNPRFGGVYPHAHECGLNFPKLLLNNVSGASNRADIGTYEAGWIMMTYEDIVSIPPADALGPEAA
ncbi:ATP-grasp domain-containing protein [Ancrocorticia populi]|uniref:Carbamoyl phosphate synthase n=1 Tax=Ancrocorticia populi TaxID=2175228 RepID=A0A2V1KB01_9ACTO|nr:carbamoyl phosphate synthase [Ancrocorticia populi]